MLLIVSLSFKFIKTWKSNFKFTFSLVTPSWTRPEINTYMAGRTGFSLHHTTWKTLAEDDGNIPEFYQLTGCVFWFSMQCLCYYLLSSVYLSLLHPFNHCGSEACDLANTVGKNENTLNFKLEECASLCIGRFRGGEFQWFPSFLCNHFQTGPEFFTYLFSPLTHSFITFWLDV